MQNDQDIDQILDNMEFSALTDGLGFHHSVSDKKEVQKTLAQKSNQLEQDLKRHLDHLKAEAKESPNLNRGDLTPFYADLESEVLENEPETLSDLIPEEDKKEVIELASSTQRGIAWLLDMVFVLSLAMITMVLAFIASDIPLIFLKINMSFYLVLAVLFFVLYFSVLDATSHSTFGKRLMGITILRKLKPISLLRSSSRSLFVLASFLLLGLPMILKTQDLFFDTQVIKR